VKIPYLALAERYDPAGAIPDTGLIFSHAEGKTGMELSHFSRNYKQTRMQHIGLGSPFSAK